MLAKYRRVAMLLALDIVDSKGSPVGTPTEYKVQPTNSSKACLPSSLRHTSSVSIAIESTDPKMCTPLNIRIDGGQKPYTVTFAPVGSATVNITMGANDDSLYWINTFPPPTAFYVAASDRCVEWDLRQRGATELSTIKTARVYMPLPTRIRPLVGQKMLAVPVKSHVPSIRETQAAIVALLLPVVSTTTLAVATAITTRTIAKPITKTTEGG